MEHYKRFLEDLKVLLEKHDASLNASLNDGTIEIWIDNCLYNGAEMLNRQFCKKTIAEVDEHIKRETMRDKFMEIAKNGLEAHFEEYWQATKKKIDEKNQ